MITEHDKIKKNHTFTSTFHTRFHGLFVYPHFSCPVTFWILWPIPCCVIHRYYIHQQCMVICRVVQIAALCARHYILVPRPLIFTKLEQTLPGPKKGDTTFQPILVQQKISNNTHNNTQNTLQPYKFDKRHGLISIVVQAIFLEDIRMVISSICIQVLNTVPIIDILPFYIFEKDEY